MGDKGKQAEAMPMPSEIDVSSQNHLFIVIVVKFYVLYKLHVRIPPMLTRQYTETNI